jgi:hypothetical protein
MFFVDGKHVLTQFLMTGSARKVELKPEELRTLNMKPR